MLTKTLSALAHLTKHATSTIGCASTRKKTPLKRAGSDAEDKAAHFLTAQGFTLLEQNFYCKGGEIDLIVIKQDHLHFIEVKARKNTQHGHPLEFVTPAKQNRIRRCAETYLLKNAHYQNHPMQCDVITLLNGEIDWLQNAF